MKFLQQTVGGLPRTFWMLFSAMMVNRVGAFGMLLLPTYLITARGTTLAVAGLVTGAYGAGGAGGTLLGGVLADRWGRRMTYLVGTSAASVLMLGLGLARPIWLIAALAAATGLVHSMPGPAVVAAIVDVLPEQDRSRAFNLQFWAFNMGGAIAAALAGVIAEFSFFALFAVDAAMTGLTAILVWRLVPETRPAHVTSRAKRAPGLRVAFTDRIFLTFVGLTFVLALLAAQGTSIVQLSMESDGLRPSAYGLVVSLAGALIVLGQLFVPKLINGRRHAVVLAVAFALVGVGFAIVAAADVLWVYLAAAGVWTVGQMLAAPPNASIIAELAPAELRGRYQGVFFLVFPAAGFLAPAVGGWSLQTLGGWHWIGCAALGLAAAAGHLLTAGARERRAATIASGVDDLSVETPAPTSANVALTEPLSA